MFLQPTPQKKPSNLFAQNSSTQSHKLSWKQRFKRDIFKDNLKYLQKSNQNKLKNSKDIKNIKIQQQKRMACKQLSRLFDKNPTTYLSDHQPSYPHHGYYSSYIPLKRSQQKLPDQLQSTFPYLQYLIQKNHQQTRTNIYNQISNHLRNANQKQNKFYQVEHAWRSCLKKYLCTVDMIKMIEIYIELLKKGTGWLGELCEKYGDGCNKEVFFYRVCQAAKYFKPVIKINKNIRSTMEANEQISEVTLPKTAKLLFCAICLLYDCNHHNMDQKAGEMNYTYVSKKNIIDKKYHISQILQLLKFHLKLQSNLQQSSNPDNFNSSTKPLSSLQMQLQIQQGQQLHNQLQDNTCSQKCYKRFFHVKNNKNNLQEYKKIKNNRRPIMSPLFRALINMGIEIFSYQPCLIWSLLVQEGRGQSSQGGIQGNSMGSSMGNNNAATCESVFFYFVEEYNIAKKLENKLFNSQDQMLANQTSRLLETSSLNLHISTNKKSKKQHLRFDHQDLQNYRIGVCYHYFTNTQPFDHSCEKCCCRRRGFCLPECQCPPECTIMKKGCSCKSGQCRTKKCPCYSSHQQCIPLLCKGCFNTSNIHNKKNQCKNYQILLSQTKHIKIGASNIMGLGGFAGEDIAKDELVAIYTGQVIQHQIDYLRQGLRSDDTFYNFGLAEGGAIDARFIGNKSRFINHQKGGNENLFSSTMFSEGKFRTVLYAKKNIKKGEELFFDYDVGGELVKNFPGKYEFIKKKS